MGKLKSIFCILFRHSRIIETCFGYIYCARCGAQLGDSLGGYWDSKDNVIMGHNCDKCQENYKKMTFGDKFLVKNPLEVK